MTFSKIDNIIRSYAGDWTTHLIFGALALGLVIIGEVLVEIGVANSGIS